MPQLHFTPGKTRYPLYKKLGGPQGRSGQAENLIPTGIQSQIIQPVVSRYTDWATGPTDGRDVWLKCVGAVYNKFKNIVHVVGVELWVC